MSVSCSGGTSQCGQNITYIWMWLEIYSSQIIVGKYLANIPVSQAKKLFIFLIHKCISQFWVPKYKQRIIY